MIFLNQQSWNIKQLSNWSKSMVLSEGLSQVGSQVRSWFPVLWKVCKIPMNLKMPWSKKVQSSRALWEEWVLKVAHLPSLKSFTDSLLPYLLAELQIPSRPTRCVPVVFYLTHPFITSQHSWHTGIPCTVMLLHHASLSPGLPKHHSSVSTHVTLP